MPRPSPRSQCVCSRRGFTLAEILVVIGIIALLISLLLPSLTIARQAAQRTACAAKLQQILTAAQLQALDHNGYYPLAGVLPGLAPSELDDTYSAHYDYVPDPAAGFPRIPAPITFSLAHEMSHRHVFDSGSNDVLGPEETDDQGLIRHFICPAEASSSSEITQQSLLYSASGPSGIVDYMEAQSYNFNEAICGWDDVDQLNRLKGRASLVHQPTLTLFVADGLMGSITNHSPAIPWQPPAPAGPLGMCTWYNIASYGPVTLADALTGAGNKAGAPENFDHVRHHGKINIGFCDGHVETRVISASDLNNVFLMAP